MQGRTALDWAGTGDGLSDADKEATEALMQSAALPWSSAPADTAIAALYPSWFGSEGSKTMDSLLRVIPLPLDVLLLTLSHVDRSWAPRGGGLDI